jgi:hypothetical protein
MSRGKIIVVRTAERVYVGAVPGSCGGLKACSGRLGSLSAAAGLRG